MSAPTEVRMIGCPACAPVPEGPTKGPGCEQCEGAGWVWLVPNQLSGAEVHRQKHAILGIPAPEPPRG